MQPGLRTLAGAALVLVVMLGTLTELGAAEMVEFALSGPLDSELWEMDPVGQGDESPYNFCKELRCANGGVKNCKNQMQPRCECKPGWTGAHCEVCTEDSVCVDQGWKLCDQTFRMYETKYFNCTVLDDFYRQFSKQITGSCHFDDHPVTDAFTLLGGCTMQAWFFETGPPSLMRCSYRQCTKENADPEKLQYHCADTKCYATNVTPDKLRPYIKQATGKTLLECNVVTRRCHLTMKGFPDEMNGGCQTGVCANFPPPIPHFPPALVARVRILVYTSGTLGLYATLCLTIGLIGVFPRFRRRTRAEVMQLRSRRINDVDVPQATLTFKDITYAVEVNKREKQILHGASGYAYPGKLLGIMGPSGAGKTTLLDILALRKSTGTVGGTITVNGEPVDPVTFRRITAYVLQEVNLMATMTVRETITFSALLRLPQDMPYYEKLARVEEAIDELGLRKVADVHVGDGLRRGISGGERRRVSIGVELVTNPSILFLDEPTTGLDSANALSTMECIVRLAKKNRTIIFSIHQPRSNIFWMFDKIQLVSAGRISYFGSAKNVIGHFASLGHEMPIGYNPADYVIDVITMNEPEEIARIADEYAASKTAEETDHVIASVMSGSDNRYAGQQLNMRSMSAFATSWLEQFAVVANRTWMNTYRNPFLLKAHYVVTAVVAFFVGAIYFNLSNDFAGVQNRLGAIFFLTALFSFGSLSSLEMFVQERALFIAERANGCYRPSVYFMSKVLCDLMPLRVGPPILLATIVYPMLGLNPHFINFFNFTLLLVLTNCVAAAMCFMLGCIVPNVSVGNLIAVLTLLFYLLFGGFLINTSHMPWYARPLQWASFFNYAVEAMAVNELVGVKINFNPKSSTPILVDGAVVLSQFGFNAMNFNLDLSVLVIMFFGYLGLAFFFLYKFMRERR